MRPAFADLKTDFVFKKLFGSEEHKPLLIALLHALLELPPDRRIEEVTHLREEQRPRVEALKHSIVDVKCRDARGAVYVVEMQVLNVEGFEKRVVYNASKAYVSQAGDGDQYPTLDDVVAISICDFVLWPEAAGEPKVPLVSHWRMQEQHGGRRGLGQVQYVFVELPKLPDGRPPEDVPEEWAYVFRKAPQLREVPAFLRDAGPRAALDAARTARFTEEEWDAYDRVRVAEQDARGALSLARREGLEEGRTEERLTSRREVLRMLTGARGWTLAAEQAARVEGCQEVAALDRWIARAATAAGVEEVFAEGDGGD